MPQRIVRPILDLGFLARFAKAIVVLSQWRKNRTTLFPVGQEPLNEIVGHLYISRARISLRFVGLDVDGSVVEINVRPVEMLALRFGT